MNYRYKEMVHLHPKIQEVLDYPNTIGKWKSMVNFDWVNLTNENRIELSDRVLKMAKTIDGSKTDE